NSMGMALLMEEGGGSLGQALQRMATRDCDAAVVLENNLFLRAPAEAVEAALAATSDLIALDLLENAFNQRAHLRLPVTSFAEQNSTWVNYEGRAQSAWQVFPPACALRPAGEWLTPVAPLAPHVFDGGRLLVDTAERSPVFAKLKQLRAVSNRLC